MKHSGFCLLVVILFSDLGYSQDKVTANAARMESRILALSKFGSNPGGGVSRPGYGKADIEARSYIMGLMIELGLSVQIDAAGNILARREGTEPELPYISFGSHIDSVPFGGNYDGDVGVISALECIELLNENDIRTRHPLEVIVFPAEEDGLFGSKGMSTGLSDSELDFVVNSQKTARNGIRDIGGDPDNLESARRRKEEILVFLELHIEQGAILYNEQVDIGVVEGIVGIEEWSLEIIGKANHAGTTPMHLRKDALVAASKVVLAVNEEVNAVNGRQVGTVGELSVEPHVSNIVPGKVALTIEMRDLERARVLAIFEKINNRIQVAATETDTHIRVNHELSHKPAFTDLQVQKIIARAAQDLGYSFKNMPSGAGHDAQEMALLAPIGMIFVPSKDGISHSPDEYTSKEDMAMGASVLLRTILIIDKEGI